MKRPDWETIRTIVKAKTMGDEELKEMLNLPYFYLSDKNVREQPFMSDFFPEEVLEQRGPQNALTRQTIPKAEMVYDNFVMSVKANVALMDPDTGEYEHVECNYWGAIEVTPEGRVGLSLFFNYEDRKEDVWWWFGFIDVRESEGQIALVEPRPFDFYLEAARVHFGMRLATDEQFEGYMKGLNQQAGQFYVYVMRLMNYLKYGDKHLVEVTPSKPPKKNSALHKKRPWAGATGPRILLLDRMPTTQSKGTGTHASPKPHRRRGHWKTLRHPRYRHHPQYQQKIYCKPSFVGPRQVSYEGNIYRLVQPLEDMEIAS